MLILREKRRFIVTCNKKSRRLAALDIPQTYMILDWVFKATPWPIKYNEENPNHWVIEGFNQNLNIRSAL